MYIWCTSLEPDILRPESPQRRAKAWTLQKTRHLEKAVVTSTGLFHHETYWKWTWSTSLKAAWKTKGHFEKLLICTRWSKVYRHQNISPICTCWTLVFKTMSINSKLPLFREDVAVDIWTRICSHSNTIMDDWGLAHSRRFSTFKRCSMVFKSQVLPQKSQWTILS